MNQKPIPIRKKGCKNVGWIYGGDGVTKLLVPLHPGKPTNWVIDWYDMNGHREMANAFNVTMDEEGRWGTAPRWKIKQADNQPSPSDTKQDEH